MDHIIVNNDSLTLTKVVIEHNLVIELDGERGTAGSCCIGQQLTFWMRTVPVIVFHRDDREKEDARYFRHVPSPLHKAGGVGTVCQALRHSPPTASASRTYAT